MTDPQGTDAMTTSTTDHPARSGSSHGWRPPAHRVRVCLLASCQGQVGAELTSAIEQRLGIGLDERSSVGAIALEGLECIGLCGIAESALIDDEPAIGRDAVLQAVERLLG
jgi:NADH:ubiquinone oxidoreductase subunit E